MKIDKIDLKTDKLPELFHFYNDILGIESSEKNDSSFSILAGESTITFENDSSYPGAFYHFAFNIPENKLDDSIKWLKGKAELISLHGDIIFDFKAWDAHSIYFYDPAGNIVEFIARHRLQNSSNEVFSGKSILSVSEIGMPVDNVREFYEKLYSDFELPLFTGDLKTFTAGGDDNGLIIIVPEDRNWFPDCGPAKIFPISLEIDGVKKKEILLEKYGYKIKSIPKVSVTD